MVTWTLVRELPSACEDASFNEEINCCTDSETKLNVFLEKENLKTEYLEY